jgi:GNAT superfamily N-acetyltransferase
MELSVCATDEDYDAWRAVRMAVLPDELCATVAELREQDSPDRVMLLARVDGRVVGSGLAGRAETADAAFAAPRVLPEHRRRGIGSALLRALAEHCTSLGLPELRAGVDAEHLPFADAFGFVEVDREIEQVRTIGDEPPPSSSLPTDIEVTTSNERPELWPECFESFGKQVLADFALHAPLVINREQWNTTWRGDPMFLALHQGEVIGCAGLNLDSDQPHRAENALTAVRRDWRGRGIASHLKRRTLHWAATNGVREVYTWTQVGNESMRQLNEHLGYVTRQVGITVSRPLPL